MRRPSIWLMAAAWLLVVVAVSGVTWTVIDSAGRDVLATHDPAVLPAEGVSTGVPTRSPRDRQPPSPGSTSSGSTPDPSRTPPAPTDAPTPSQQATPLPQLSQQPATSPAPQVRSWQGAAGTVTARCSGSRISLVSASPSNGWEIEVEKRGPGEVEVELESRGEGERRTRVEGSCVGGAPRFTADLD